MGEVQRDPTTAPAVVAPDYARLGKAVSHLEELAAGNLHGEVCEGGDSGASPYRISSTRSRSASTDVSAPYGVPGIIRSVS